MSEDIQQIILNELREHRRESHDRHEKMDIRVRSVEDFQSKQKGIILAIVTVIPGISGLITWAVTKYNAIN